MARKCRSCEKEGHPMTIFGNHIGCYCEGCYKVEWVLAHRAAGSLINGINDPICLNCGDDLTGHEDESKDRCRWCVTCTESGPTSTAARPRRTS